MNRTLLFAAALGLLLPAAAGATELPLELVLPAEGPHRAALDRHGLDTPLVKVLEAWQGRNPGKRCKPRLVVYKARRRLDAACGDEVVKSYVVNLGGDPVGDKVRQGDSATPEGRLTICTRNEQSAFYRFLGVGYPDAGDAKRGVRDGLIAEDDGRKIEDALERGTCPPWGTRLGGAIGVHGHGGYEIKDGVVHLVDWTLGCVALRDDDVKELFYGFVKVGTPIEIRRE